MVEPVEEPVLRQRNGVGPVLGLRRLAAQALVLLLEVLRPGDDLRHIDLLFLQSVPQVGVDRVLPFRALKVPYLVLLGASVVDLLHALVQGAQVVQGHLIECRFPKVSGVLLVEGLRKLRVVPEPLGDLRPVLQRLLAAALQVVGGQELFHLLVRRPGDRFGARHAVDALDELPHLSLSLLALLELLLERGDTHLRFGHFAPQLQAALDLKFVQLLFCLSLKLIQLSGCSLLNPSQPFRCFVLKLCQVLRLGLASCFNSFTIGGLNLILPLPQLGLIALDLFLDRRVLDGQFLHGRLRGDLLRGCQQAGVDVPHLRAELDAQRLHHVVVDLDHPRP